MKINKQEEREILKELYLIKKEIKGCYDNSLLNLNLTIKIWKSNFNSSNDWSYDPFSAFVQKQIFGSAEFQQFKCSKLSSEEKIKNHIRIISKKYKINYKKLYICIIMLKFSPRQTITYLKG